MEKSVLDKGQLRPVLESFKSFLTQELTNASTSFKPNIVKAVQALEVIWQASVRSKTLQFDEFYHNLLNQKIDVRTEHSLWLGKASPWCFTKNAAWSLNTQTKADFLRADSRILMN
jgi:hypothetical protein